LFMKWLEEYTRLEDAGYVTVSFVGVRLLLRVFNDQLVPPEWVMVIAIAALFAWGFSKRREEEGDALSPTSKLSDSESAIESTSAIESAADKVA